MLVFNLIGELLGMDESDFEDPKNHFRRVETMELVVPDNNKHLVLVGGNFIIHSKLPTLFDAAIISKTNQILVPSKELEVLNSQKQVCEMINLHSRQARSFSSQDFLRYNGESFSFIANDNKENPFKVSVASHKDISKNIYYS